MSKITDAKNDVIKIGNKNFCWVIDSVISLRKNAMLPRLIFDQLVDIVALNYLPIKIVDEAI